MSLDPRSVLAWPLALLSVMGCERQTPQLIEQAGTPAEFVRRVPEEFGRVAGIVVMEGDSAAIVADLTPHGISMINPLSDYPATPLGRQGGGPGEYRQVSAPFLDHSTPQQLGFYDPEQRRLVILAMNGTPVHTQAVDLPGMTLTSFSRDREGRVHFAAVPAYPDDDPARPDSGTHFALRLGGEPQPEGKFLTSPLVLVVSQRTSGASQSVNRMVVASPVGSSDLWAVGPDGFSIVIREASGQLFLREGGSERRLSATWTPVALGDAEAAAARRALMGGDLPEWPGFLPLLRPPLVLDAGGRRAYAAIRGPEGDSTSKFLVIDLDRDRERILSVPAGRRIRAATSRYLYTTRRTEAGGDVVEIYAIPSPH